MNEENSSKKIIWIILGIIVFLLIAFGVYYFIFRKSADTGTGPQSLFGGLVTSGIETSGSTGGDVEKTPVPGSNLSGGSGTEEEPLFRQLSTIPIAGAIAIERGGKSYVRYVARENGHVFEVDPKTGSSIELTNTLIPRIYEAYWVKGGNSVLLRYLTQDQLSRRDIIKTYLTHLDLPTENNSGAAVPGALGSLRGEFLPNDISAVSISPNGTHLFYLEPIAEGVSGKIITLATMATKEIFRNSFSEWLPQLLDNGNVILTTKPSTNVPGFSYLYNPANKTLTRIIREKNALTTLSERGGSRILYSENLTGNTMLGFYDKQGVSAEEGVVSHESPIPLATLPEKCVWSKNTTLLYCGAFTSTPRAQIPDDWYQGVLSFADSFWLIDTNTIEITFLADPKKSIQKEFDVFMPFIGNDEHYFFFTNKKDNTLWEMRLVNTVAQTAAEAMPGLTPDELRDAQGSVSVTPAAPVTKATTGILRK
jgi:hypothetical protein